MSEKLITKSFERLLEKGKHRGFITYEELSKSLGKRSSNNENIERAFIIIADEKVTLVEKKSQYQSNKKKETPGQTEEKKDYYINDYLLHAATQSATEVTCMVKENEHHNDLTQDGVTTDAEKGMTKNDNQIKENKQEMESEEEKEEG